MSSFSPEEIKDFCAEEDVPRNIAKQFHTLEDFVLFVHETQSLKIKVPHYFHLMNKNLN